jgi:hypothetical protein
MKEWKRMKIRKMDEMLIHKSTVWVDEQKQKQNNQPRMDENTGKNQQKLVPLAWQQMRRCF